MKHVLVTGANKGIGRAIVAAVLERDDTAVWLGSRDVNRGHAARDALVGERPGRADRIRVLPIDVSSAESVAAAADAVSEPLYGLVNNAGVIAASDGMKTVLDVNTRGVQRVTSAFLPRMAEAGRIVNVTSASGPIYVSKCSEARQAFFRDRSVTWEALEALIDECLALEATGGLDAAGLAGDAYGLSKALANSYTMAVAREHPGLHVNACTPGFIETDMTRPLAAQRGQTPAQMGMKPPAEGTRSTVHLLFGDVATGHYFGSDAVRSPLDRYRGPGDPPYEG